MASWLVRLIPDQGVRVEAQASDIVLCCSRQDTRHLALKVPVSTKVYTM